MEMVGALWVTAAGTAYASWAGGALAATRPWKLPALMSRTTTEVKKKNPNTTLNELRQEHLISHDRSIKSTGFSQYAGLLCFVLAGPQVRLCNWER